MYNYGFHPEGKASVRSEPPSLRLCREKTRPCSRREPQESAFNAKSKQPKPQCGLVSEFKRVVDPILANC